ncbi:MAG: VOC family protein [Spirochaetales bacterium]|nr:VOC family protein [Spirochaetales bacterium]
MQLSYKHSISFIWSRDIEKTERFYTNILGFKKAFESEGWIELAVPGVSNSFIAINQWRKEGTYPINEFLTFGVEDLNAFKAHLLAEEVTLKDDIIDFHEQGMRMLKFFDHDNNIITVSEVS